MDLMLPRPQTGESQADYAMRFHSVMRQAIPDTDERNRQCFAMWDRFNGIDKLRSKARATFSPNEFDHHPDVPLFTEHSTKDKAGRMVIYDRNALAAIADRCNHRISDTGNFAPLTAGHTPDREEVAKGAAMPDVLGYAGPYRLGQVGNDEPRWAIFGDEWHHKEDAPRLRKLRRRSPEVWLEERMEDRFFDPIAALGAETPRLDMGMARFRRMQTPDGRTVMKYSAFPSAASVFVPSTKYESEDEIMLTPEDVQQVVAALLETEPMQWVQSQMGGGSEPQSVTPDVDGGMAAPADAGDVTQNQMPEDPAAAGATPPPAPAAAAAPAPDAAAAPLPEALPPEEPKQPYTCDDDDVEMMGRYMAGEVDDDELMEYRAGRYAAESGNVEEGNIGKPSGEAAVEGQLYQRRRTGNAAAYSRLQSENKQMKLRLQKIENRAVNAEREATLVDLSRYYAMDLEKQIERCRAEKMSADVFTDYCDVIRENFEPLPVGIPQVYAPSVERQTANAESYSREETEAATRYVMSQRQQGNAVTYAEGLEHVRKQRA